MVKQFAVIGLLLFFTLPDGYSQSHFFFSDSDHGDYYESGLAFPGSPSLLDQAGPSGDKIPVSTAIKYEGNNSLRLTWTSHAEGEWSALVIAPGFPFQDISGDETLGFRVYSPEGIPAASLPEIFMEGAPGNTKSNRYPLSDHVEAIPAGEWVSLNVPLNVFFDDPDQTGIDFQQVKAIIFGQGTADGVEHTLYIDDVRAYRGTGEIPVPAVPSGITAQGFDCHVELRWDPAEAAREYQVYRSGDGGASFTPVGKTSDTVFIDFTGQQRGSFQYQVKALNQGKESTPSATVEATTNAFTDDELLTMVQEYTFRYFWDFAHPASGMARERNTSGNVVTTGGSGFGVMAILAGIERGFITRVEGRNRVLKMVEFLATADRFHGAWPHWMDGATGEVIPFSERDDGADLVETAFMVQGLLTAREYFDRDDVAERELAEKITALWEAVEWDWFLKPPGNVLLWHWSPEHGFGINLEIKGFNETMIVYLLAIASPTHPVPANTYETGWAGGNYRNGKEFYGIPLATGPDYGGPLFFAHYSFLGFDPRDKKDAYANYFIRNKNHTLIHRQYSIDNPGGYAGYDGDTWGLTASDDPAGYKAHAPGSGDNGTVTPTAALSSMPYTPEISLDALKSFYRDYGDKLWGPMGFYDAFNPEEGWFADSYLATDQGPIIGMIENYRSGLLWDNFMKNPEIPPMLDAIGFEDVVTGIEGESITDVSLRVFPNPFSSHTRIAFSLGKGKAINLEVYNVLGRKVKVLATNQPYTTGTHDLTFNSRGLPPGIYTLRLQAGQTVRTTRMIVK